MSGHAATPPHGMGAGPRSFGAGPRAYNPAPRSFGAGPRAYNPAPRSFGAGPQAYNPAPRSFGAGPREFHPGGRVYGAPGRVEPWHGGYREFHGPVAETWRQGRWYHGYHDGRLAWWWLAGSAWIPYAVPVYPYPDPYVVSPYVAAPPDTTGQDWYCQSADAYYPDVTDCPEGWVAVPVE